MSRLLFAAARGARIQLQHQTCGDWCPAGYASLLPEPEGITRRIHPDDAHLAYGPISTALREAATQEIDYLQDLTDVYINAVIEEYENGNELGYLWGWARNSTSMHKSLFLLILAEALVICPASQYRNDAAPLPHAPDGA